MALSKEDRIEFSKKLASVPVEIAAVERSKQAVLAQQQKDQALDDAHKRLVDSKTPLIDGYQSELTQLDGNVRSNLTETDISDAASFTSTNFLYPRDPSNPPPSTAPQIWIKTKPYTRNKITGRLFTEVFGGPVTKESDLTALISATLASLNSYALIERVSGQSASNGGSCSDPQYLDSASCTLNSGIWTPGPDVVANNAAIQALMTTLISQVNAWKSFLLTEIATIVSTDTNATRAGQNTAAINQINATVANIDAWLAFVNFNTAHGQTTFSGFYGYNPALLGPTKLQTAQVAILTGSISTRDAFVATRISQLNTNLGSVVQDLGTGDSTGSGLYFERLGFLGLRLNMLGGSLIKVKGAASAINAQNEQISNINSAKTSYEALLFCSNLVAPSNGTKTLHLINASGFNPGDTVYLISETQEELQLTIDSKNGNSLIFTKAIPAKYRESELARVYKDLT